MPVTVQPLSGTLVVELAWYLPIARAGRELARLGARVVRVEAAADFGGPLSEDDVQLGQHTAAWRAELDGWSSSLSRLAPRTRGKTERSRKCSQIGDAVRLARITLVTVDQDRMHAERAGALDIVLVGVTDHDGFEC